MSAADRLRQKSRLPAISPSLADRICRGMLPLAQDAYALSELLAARGFTAHLPWQKFFESFASGDLELQEYRTHQIETAKNTIGRPWPMSIFDHSLQYFSSEYVTALFSRRDADNGVDEDQLSTRYPKLEALWRYEVTACDRRRVQLETQHRGEYERLRAQAAEVSRITLRNEIPSTTDRLFHRSAECDDQVDCYVAVMEFHAAKLGLHKDATKSKSRSKGNIPIFSKEIAGGWDLCWAMEQPSLFISSPQEGLFMPNLQVRSRHLAGATDRAPYDRYLEFRFGQIVPEFDRGYLAFNDLASLETIVCANLTVYELMAAVIEGAIRRCLLH